MVHQDRRKAGLTRRYRQPRLRAANSGRFPNSIDPSEVSELHRSGQKSSVLSTVASIEGPLLSVSESGDRLHHQARGRHRTRKGSAFLVSVSAALLTDNMPVTFSERHGRAMSLHRCATAANNSSPNQALQPTSGASRLCGRRFVFWIVTGEVAELDRSPRQVESAD